MFDTGLLSLDRGFERIEDKLRQCGGHIERLTS